MLYDHMTSLLGYQFIYCIFCRPLFCITSLQTQQESDNFYFPDTLGFRWGLFVIQLASLKKMFIIS